MNNLYPYITARTGYDIYYNDEFKANVNYFEFREDYNKLIQREIKRNNIQGIYFLCSWTYYWHNTPMFDPMLEIALKHEEVTPVTLAVIFYMWKYCKEYRDASITLNDALKFASSNDKKGIVLEIFCGVENQETYAQTLLSHGINFETLKSMFNSANEELC